MKLPTITKKQQEILHLLYTYRFLNRIQIQALLNHKDKRRISAWLKDVRQKQYVQWIYDSKDLATKTKPAIYYIGLNGVRWLKQQTYLGEDGQEYYLYLPTEVHKRYKEATRQPDFIARCLLIADCAIVLAAKSINRTHYTSLTAADYNDPNSDYSFLTELHPHACFIRQTPRTTTVYLLEVFDPTTPRYMIKKRINDYITYLENDEWQDATADDTTPIVLLVCPTTAELIYVKRRIHRLREETDEESYLRVTTTQNLKLEGIAGKIWEEA